VSEKKGDEMKNETKELETKPETMPKVETLELGKYERVARFDIDNLGIVHFFPKQEIGTKEHPAKDAEEIKEIQSDAESLIWLALKTCRKAEEKANVKFQISKAVKKARNKQKRDAGISKSDILP
jgi:hypothetical protein